VKFGTGRPECICSAFNSQAVSVGRNRGWKFLNSIFLLDILFKLSTMRMQVLLRSFGLPILLAIILILRLSIGLTPFRAFAETVFVVSIAISRLFSDDRYVQTISMRDSSIVITYFTRFLQLKSFDFALSDIVDVRLAKRLSIGALWSPILDLRVNGEWIGFYVVNKKLCNEIRQHLASGHIEFMK
jgi:hypothetical protein